jgi:hypothetical protein
MTSTDIINLALSLLATAASMLFPTFSTMWWLLLAAACAMLTFGIGRKIYERKQLPAPVGGRGGRGGNATVGGNGIAIGGPGGHAGSGGRGGDGGGGTLQGDGLAAGGAGGHAGEEGVWRPPAKSGYEVAQRARGFPVDPELRKYGRGGAQPGYEPKLHIIEQLRDAYFRERAQPIRTIFADIYAVPVDYLNEALQASGQPWRVRIVDEDEYEFHLPGC